MVTIILLASAFSLVLNLVVTPLILKLARRQEWLDTPNHRSVHKDPVPRLGGAGIFLSFGLAIGFIFVGGFAGWWTLPPAAYQPSAAWLAVGLASTLVLGLLDDFVQFRAIYKFLLQMFGAVCVLAAGLSITEIAIPYSTMIIHLGPFGPLLTVIWVLGITNAVNLIDGMDGLAGGLSALALAFLGFVMITNGHHFAAVVCFVLVGSLVGFLVFNLPPARIFMGDAGSLSLGFMLATIPLWGGPQHSLFQEMWLLPVTLVLLPIGDTVAAMLRRARLRVPIWSPDREHTHHKLLHLGLSTRQVLLVFYGGFLLTGSPVLVLAILTDRSVGSVGLLWMSVASIVVVTVLFTVLHWVYRKKVPDPEVSEKTSQKG